MNIYYEVQIFDDEFGKFSDYTLDARITSHMETIGWKNERPGFEFLIKPEFGSLLRVGDVVDLDFMNVESPVHILLLENLPVDADDMESTNRRKESAEFWKSFLFDCIAFTITERRMRFTENLCIIELKSEFTPI